MRYPSRLLHEEETILRLFRPHWRVAVPAVVWAMLLAAVTGAAFAALQPRHAVFGLGGAVTLWVLVAGRRLVRWWSTTYVLTSERIVVRAGLLSRSGTEIPIESIDDVRFRQRFLQRLLGYGEVLVVSAGRSGPRRLSDIPDPEAFQSEIWRARELRTRQHPVAEGWSPATDDAREE